MSRTGNLLANYAILPMPRLDEFLSTSFINNNLAATVISFRKERALNDRNIHHLEEIIVHSRHLHDIKGILIVARYSYHISTTIIPIERNIKSRTAILNIRHSPDFCQTLIALVSIAGIYRNYRYMIIIIPRIEPQHQLVLTIHDVKQTEQQTRDNELDAQQTKFPTVAILIIATESDGYRNLVVKPTRQQAANQQYQNTDSHQYPTATIKHQRAYRSRKEVFDGSLAKKHKNSRKNNRQPHMHQSLRENDGMNVLRFGTITLTNSHFARTTHKISHDDKQIVHHRSKEEDKSDNSHNPSHLLDIRILGVNIAQYREIIVQFYSHILHLLQRKMILSHLIHVRLEFFCLMPLCQPDVGSIAIISHPLASAIIGIYVWHTTPRQNHLRTMKGRTPWKRFENTIDGKSGSRIFRKREMLTNNITTYLCCRF